MTAQGSSSTGALAPIESAELSQNPMDETVKRLSNAMIAENLMLGRNGPLRQL